MTDTKQIKEVVFEVGKNYYKDDTRLGSGLCIGFSRNGMPILETSTGEFIRVAQWKEREITPSQPAKTK